jgi:hypothetical protein
VDEQPETRRKTGERFVAAQRELKEDWGLRSYEEALRSWIATVAIIEVEYVGEWEDFAHELIAREYLEELSRRSPKEWVQRIERAVNPWDERFREATVAETEPHLPNLAGEAGWWQFRSPRRWRKPASEELAADPTWNPKR